MKQLPFLLLAALLCLTLSACSDSSAASNRGNSAMVANPMQEKDSLAQINDAIGCFMKAPAGMTVSDEKFFVISGAIGDYRFTVDGISYTLRASATAEDISGVQVNGTTLGAAANAAGGTAETAVFDSGRWTRWFEGDMQYSLLSDETGTTGTSTLYRVRDALR